MLILGAIGAVVAVAAQARCFAAFLVWDFFVSLAVYSWAGEKFAWLVLHPLLPVVLLAGVGVQAIWQARGALRCGRARGRGGRAVYVGLASWWVNVDRGADPRESSSPPSPRPRSRRSPTRCWRWPTAAARARRR